MKFLLIVAIVLFIIVLIRLSGVVELANKLRGGGNDFATEKDNRQMGH